MSHGAGHTATSNENSIDQQPAKRQVSADAFRALTLKLKGEAPPAPQPAQTIASAAINAAPQPAPQPPRVPTNDHPAALTELTATHSAPQTQIFPQVAELTPVEPLPHGPDENAMEAANPVATGPDQHQPFDKQIETVATPREPDPSQTDAVPVSAITQVEPSPVTPAPATPVSSDADFENVVSGEEPAAVGVAPVEPLEFEPPQSASSLEQSLSPQAVSQTAMPPLTQAPETPANPQSQTREPATEKKSTSIVVDDDANKAFEQQLQALKKQNEDRLKLEPTPSDQQPVAKVESSARDESVTRDHEQPTPAEPSQAPAEAQTVADPLVAAMQLINPADGNAEKDNLLGTVLPTMPVLDNFEPLTQSAQSIANVEEPHIEEPPKQEMSQPQSEPPAQRPQELESKGAVEEPLVAEPKSEPPTQRPQESESKGAVEEPLVADPLPKQPVQSAMLEDAGPALAPDTSQSAPTATPVQASVAVDPKSGETARALLDMMSMPSGASQPHERSLAADTLLQLFPKMPERDLIALSERVCLMEDPPSLLVEKLINHSSAKVAQPLLEGANGIDEQDFLRLVATCDAERLLMIAKRRNLSSSICDALIVRGQATVNLTLARNPGAKFSHDAFVTLGEIAKTQPTLQAPLATRGDTPAPIAFELFWSLPTELRRYVLSRFLTDSSTLDKILKIAKNVDSASDNQSEEVKFPSKRSVDALVELLVEGAADKSAAKMAEMAGITQENARRIIADPDGEPLTVAFKTIGLSRNQFEEALKRCISSPNVMLRPDRSATELQNLFDSLSFNKARTLITYWDWAIEKTGPYARRAG